MDPVHKAISTLMTISISTAVINISTAVRESRRFTVLRQFLSAVSTRINAVDMALDNEGALAVTEHLQIHAKHVYLGSSPFEFPKSRMDPNRGMKIKKSPEQELSDCIHSLSFKGMDSRRNNIRLAHDFTCDWLLKTAEFRKLVDRTDIQANNDILQIKGHPGVGKSTLMKHALLHCEENFKGYNIAFHFFNGRGGPLERSPLGLLRSLVVQLIEQASSKSLVQSCVSYFTNKNTRHGEFQWDWTTEELKDCLLIEYAKSQSKPTLLLIDALDECNDTEVEEVTDFLEDLSERAVQSGSNLMICLSSRHYPNIDITKKIGLVVEAQLEHERDIAKYVQGKLKVKDPELQQRVLDKSRQIFIWVVLVVELLNRDFLGGKFKDIGKRLDDIPGDLDKLFSKLLGLECPEDDRKASVLLFQWVLFREQEQRSGILTCDELYFGILAGTEPDSLGSWDGSEEKLEAVTRFVTRVSRGLVEVVLMLDKKNNTVQFIHQSVVDFLTRQQRLADLDSSLTGNIFGFSHAQLAACCLNYIKQEELKRLAPRLTPNMYEGKRILRSYPLLGYSLFGLLSHAEKAQAAGISQVSLLQHLREPAVYETFQAFYYLLGHPGHGMRDYPLLPLLSLEGHYHLLRTCLDADIGFGVNARGGYYGTALQTAAFCRFENIVQLLLRHMAEVNARAGLYGTALQAALVARDLEIVALLLRHGADANIQGGDFGTALQAAAVFGAKDFVAFTSLPWGQVRSLLPRR